MKNTRSSLFGRLRASKLLPAWLLVLAIASALAGMHAASHIGSAPGSLSTHLAPADLDHEPDSARHGDCPVCRLAGSGFLPLPAIVLLVPLALGAARAPALPPAAPRRHDVAARWRLRRKQGPPRFSR